MRINTLTELGKVWKSITMENFKSLGIPSEMRSKIISHSMEKDYYMNFNENVLSLSKIGEHLEIFDIFPEEYNISLYRVPFKHVEPTTGIQPEFKIKNGIRLLLYPPFGYNNSHQIIIRGIWIIKDNINKINDKINIIAEDQHHLPYFSVKEYKSKSSWFITNLKQTVMIPLNSSIMSKLLGEFANRHFKDSNIMIILPISLIILIFEYGIILNIEDDKLISLTYDFQEYYNFSSKPSILEMIKLWNF
jgi:hypothetical protein